MTTLEYSDGTHRADRESPEHPPSLNAGRLWSAGVATATVAALAGLVGILVARAVFRVALDASADARAFTESAAVRLCVISAVAALAATGMIHLLWLSTPRP